MIGFLSQEIEPCNTLTPRPRALGRLLALAAACLAFVQSLPAAPGVDANRLTYLDGDDPFYVHAAFPKLTTTQWIGETNVEAAVILSIDDLKDPARHETFLRPILERLKQIDGRAPVSVMCVKHDPNDPRLQTWLQEGLSLEVHTVTHRHPILSASNFLAGANDYHDSVALLHRIPGNTPVAVRLPYCDSMNVASPRFYAEIFNRTNAHGQFLGIDSSILHYFTTNDPTLPRHLVLDADGRERWRTYLPEKTNTTTRVSMKGFATTVADYPYPYVIGQRCWEFPALLPSDWQAHNAHGSHHPATVADWQAALDAVVLKQGVLTLCFHPHGWIRSQQIVDFIDYAVRQHGNRVKFLTFREAYERLNRNLLAGQPLRGSRGQDNGVRLLDLNRDGYLDVVMANQTTQTSRIWDPRTSAWQERRFPILICCPEETEQAPAGGVRFGILQADGLPFALQLMPTVSSAWQFNGDQWLANDRLLPSVGCSGQPIYTWIGNRDRGVRLRDWDRDGRSELLVGNELQNGIFAWSDQDQTWNQLDAVFPAGTRIVTAQGRDAGLRFVDWNEDGFDDLLFSDSDYYLLRLFVSQAQSNQPRKIGWNNEIVSGWRHPVDSALRAARLQTAGIAPQDFIPPIVRAGPQPNNGVWFQAAHLFVQNEDTAHLPAQADSRAFAELLRLRQSP